MGSKVFPPWPMNFFTFTLVSVAKVSHVQFIPTGMSSSQDFSSGTHAVCHWTGDSAAGQVNVERLMM